jgi:RP/EB family microtubule-associated protein
MNMKAQKMGRLELLAWFNDFIEADYSKIENCCDGVGYAQVIDAVHPGCVPLSKLNFHAKHKDDYIRNLRI